MAKREIKAMVSLEHAFPYSVGSLPPVGSSSIAGHPDPHMLWWQWSENQNRMVFTNSDS